VLVGNVIVTAALPDVQLFLEGSPLTVLPDEKRHFVAPCTIAWRCTLPPVAGSAEGVAVKRTMLALFRPTCELRALPATDAERVCQTEATREPCV